MDAWALGRSGELTVLSILTFDPVCSPAPLALTNANSDQPTAPAGPRHQSGSSDTTTISNQQRPVMPADVEARYWDQVGSLWRSGHHRLWRDFTDRLQLALIASWLPVPSAWAGHKAAEQEALSLLKTDLFDEVANPGLVPTLLLAGIHVVGIDLSPLIVDEAVARNPRLEGMVADVRMLPFANDSFDAAFSGSTLDHLSSARDILRALEEIARVLRPGGRLMITMDNPVNPILRLRNGPLLGLFRWLGIVPYQVGMTLAPGPLQQTLRAAGFEVLQTKALLHCPRVLCVGLSGSVARLAPRWQEAYLRALGFCEVLDRWPTRWLTGHYIAIHAVKR